MNKSVSNSILQDIIKKNKGTFKYELIDWIPIKKLSWKALSCNPNAIELLEAKIKIEKSLKKAAYEKIIDDKKIDWVALSSNPEAIKLLKENPKDIDWKALSRNPNAIEMLKGNQKDIDWSELSSNHNPKAIELLTDNFNDIDWVALSSNPNAIELLKKYPKNINWKALSSNPNAIQLLTDNLTKIDWEKLSCNLNAIALLKANPDKIVWHYLSTNPNAINLFTANPKKIDWWFLSRNPNPLVISLLKTHQNDIDWKELSKNPSIFIERKENNGNKGNNENKGDNICKRILTPKQIGPICWFMAAFVAMFYSQRSRKILLDTSKGWNKKKELFTILKHILDDKYLKTESRESEDYRKFSDDTFGKVLSLLHKENKKLFPYKPKAISGGFNPEYYIGRLYKLLNVDYKMYDYNIADNVFAYSFLNEEFNNDVIYKVVKKNIKTYFQSNTTFKYIEEDIIPPPILMVILRNDNKNTNFYKDLFPNNIINEGATKETLKSMQEQIVYKGVEYNLDSVLLANWNINKKNGHAIAGISCKKEKYVYNGWTRTSMDPVMVNKEFARKIPCELMKYDWNIKYNGDFCLNPAKCIPDSLKQKLKEHDICFNFSKGKRILVYVRKDAKSDTSMETITKINSVVPIKSPPKPIVNPKSPKKCPEGKVLNPKTGRCILIKKKPIVKSPPKPIVKSPPKPIVKSPPKPIVKSPPKPIVKPKSPKKCPEGKVLNPKTGRCILIKNANAAANKPLKSPKKCPEGKVLNPKTGRCILIRNIK
jgi:hypothetical protein